MAIINRQKEHKRLMIIHVSMILYSLTILIPFLLLISISLSSESDISHFGYRFIPKNIVFTAYKFIFADPGQIVQSYKISIIVAGLGTFISVLIMASCAYSLSRKDFKYKSIITFYIFFTMLFSGGLVPSYILITKYLQLQNTIWVLIIPYLVNAYHIIIIRTFFQDLPVSIFESAKIDGATELIIFIKLVLPLSKPVIATISLFGLLGRWNQWFPSLLYITDKKLYPLQYLLQRIIMNMEFLFNQMDKLPPGAREIFGQLPGESARMAMVIVAAGPMLVIFPFFQKYFAKGLTIGSIKG